MIIPKNPLSSEPPSGTSASSPTPVGSTRRSGLRSPLIWIFALVVVVATFVHLRRSLVKPRIVSVPVPADFARLDPQLRSYLSNYLQGVSVAPGDSMRHATLGMVYVANTLWKEAWLCFSNVVQLRPDSPHGHLYFALATRELGDQARALDMFRDITRKFPDFPPGFYRLSETAIRTGAADEALQASRKLTQLLPKEWRGPAGVGEALLRQGHAAEALPYLQQAVALGPGERIAHHLLGTAYRSAGRLEDAERELSLGQDAIHYPLPDEWLETVTRHMKALPDQFDRARQLTASGQAPQAVRLLEEALSWRPQDVSVLLNLALACNAAEASERAAQLLRKARELDPKNLDVLVVLTETCLELGDPDEALRIADEAIGMAPQAPQAHLARGNVLLAMEKGEDALMTFRKALELDPRNATIRLDIGDVLLRMLKRPEDALTEYRAAIAGDRGLVSGYVRVADVLLRLNRAAEARSAIDEVRRLIPQDRIVQVLEERLAKLTQP